VLIPITIWIGKFLNRIFTITSMGQLNGTVKEPNKFHKYETEKITPKASDVAEYIELFGSST